MKKSLLFLLLLTQSEVNVDAQSVDMSAFHGMAPRNIGPAGMSGRVTSIDVILADPDVIYIGTAAGGVWRSDNAGHTWKPIFDDQIAASIGAITIHQANPDIIYVGSGEGNPRNSQNSGLGMFKSMDGGKNWIHLGLEESRQIHRVVVHPDNPNQVLAGVSGATWGQSPERGVFKTTDGGTTWRKVLYVNERTGIADLVAKPDNPNVLLAAMWEHRREPWYFNSGGAGSGLYISRDGGENWRRLTPQNGLPEGELGRIGLSYSPVDPDVVYAYIESTDNAIYASNDGGENWERRSKPKDPLIGDRPFYYADLYADSQNENRLYSIASTVTVSEDGGRSWKSFANGNKIHTDHHAFWIHPTDPDFIMIGHDGGLNITHDRGKAWWFAENLPLGQFYHVRVDQEMPYNIMGGLQDNGSWLGPSQTWFKGGIRNMYWQRLSVGDGFDVVPDPKNPDYGYAMGQAGNLVRYHRPSGQLTRIKPVHPDGEYLRFNWNAGIAIDPFTENTIYYGSQYLHKSRDYGATWTIISPDLTTNDPAKQDFLTSGGLTYDVTGAEFHTTIVSIDPSPLDSNVIWVGTDDGQIQVTRDGGQSWSNTSNAITEAPRHTWVTQLNASSHNPAEAFAVLDDHRRNNWTPYVYRTKNFGKTWSRIVTDADVRGYVYCHEQDPATPELHFAGTEFGLFVSFDDAKTWQQWTTEFPTVPVSDLVIHPRDMDLVIATFGRAFWVLDDIRPLQEIAQSQNGVFSKSLHIFQVPESYAMTVGESIGYRDGKIGDALYNGENRQYGALISYFLKSADEAGDELQDQVRIDIHDNRDNLIRTIYQKPREGINRVNWQLKKNRLRLPHQAAPKKEIAPRAGTAVSPGTYRAVVTFKEISASVPVIVKADPRTAISEEDLVEKRAMIKHLDDLLESATELMDDIRLIEERVTLTESLVRISNVNQEDAIHSEIKAVKDALTELTITVQGREVQGIYRDPLAVNSQYFATSSLINNPQQSPSDNQRRQLAHFEACIEKLMTLARSFKGGPVAHLKASVDRLGLTPF